MNAQILMIKRQITKLQDKMKAVTNRREDEETQAPPPVHASPAASPQVSAYPAPLAYPMPRARPQLQASCQPVPLPPGLTMAQRVAALVALAAAPAPSDHAAPAPSDHAAPGAQSQHPAFREPLREISLNMLTAAVPAPLAMHPVNATAPVQRPVRRKPPAQAIPTTKVLRGVPTMGSYQIPLDPAMSFESVAHYLPVPPKYDDSGAHIGRIPTPEIFKQSKKRESARIKVKDMDEIFPDLPSKAAEKAAAKLKAEREKKRHAEDWSAVLLTANLEATLSGEFESTQHAPVSEIGTLRKLPGELRNKIYRLIAVNPDGEVKIVLKTGECDQGKCTHREAGNIIPGLANTCRQLRYEIMPIFCAENKTFHFDYRTVAERCTVGYLETLGSYIDLIQEYKFDIARPCWSGQQFLGDATYTYTLTTPAVSLTKQWHLHQDFTISDSLRAAIAAVRPPVTVDVICQCELVKMITGLNGRNRKYGHGSTKGCGLMALRIASAARFADYVFEMKRSKQFMWTLADCKVCKKVRFGSGTGQQV